MKTLKRVGLVLCSAMVMAAGASAENAGQAEPAEKEEIIAAGVKIAEKIPSEYMTGVKDEGGTVLAIQYPSQDYLGDHAEITKNALVYLPPDYSEDNAYDLLVLCHGIGGTELEWGFKNPFCIAKNAVDNLILNGDIRPLIIVMPNGRSTAKYNDVSFANAQSFYVFGEELRNDLLPYMDAHFATRASKKPDDPGFARQTRAMAGLSMGGMQTINIGIGDCLDLFSAFGAFSAAPTSNPAAVVASELADAPEAENIRFFYNICGTNDGTAYASAAAAAKKLPELSDRVDETNFLWQELPGGHDFNIWNLGLYNFVRILDAVRFEGE